MSDVNSNPNDFTTRQSEIHQLNAKLTYDDVMAEISEARKVKSSHDNAWETLRFRMATNAATIDQLSATAALSANQTGQTENQQAVSPIRTGVGDTLAATAYPANRAIDTATATVATAAAGIATADQAIADALGQFVSLMNQGIAALQAVVVTAAGGASTPSQTKVA